MNEFWRKHACLCFAKNLLILCCLIHLAQTFNIDTSAASVYNGADDSYFGYSVALISHLRKTWILVGAPRDNDTHNAEVVRPGALYRCPFPYQGPHSCENVLVDNSGSINKLLNHTFHNRTWYIYHKMTDQWLGVSLDVRQPYHSEIVICAHRWTDAKFVELYKDRGQYHMLGLCYIVSPDFESPGIPILALVNDERLVHATDRYVIFSMGALGMDAQFTEDNHYVAMSAPGINDWSGGVVLEKADDIKYIEPRPEKFANSYVGYSITTGRFLSDKVEYLAAGAPRMDQFGAVYIFEMSEKNIPIKEFRGTQFGGYFGSSLCAVDLNNDGLDDLLVGAPMYSDIQEEGRVFVYISEGLLPSIFTEQDVPLAGFNSPHSRFGSAITQLGDINKDGFNDVAIGAPYENENHGVVYIYHGFAKGLWNQWSQRIPAELIDTGLRGFGCSFSRPFDIDENGYNDIAVGAYISNQAVLLRTSPLISFQPQMVIVPEEFDPGSPNVSLSLCFRYIGFGETVPGNIRFNFSLMLDTGRGERLKRLVVIKDGQEHSSLEQKFNLHKNMAQCFDGFTLQVKFLQDIVDDVELSLTYSIWNDFGDECDVCPVIKVFDGNEPERFGPPVLRKIIPFAKDCGSDRKCDTNLKVKAQLLENSFLDFVVIDSTKYVDLEVIIFNEGENAYNSVLYVTIPNFLSFIRDRVVSGQDTTVCTWEERTITVSNSTFLCSLRDPLRENEVITLNIWFSASDDRDVDYLDIQLYSNTSSTESNLLDNTARIYYPIKLKPTMKLSGISFPEQLVSKPSNSGGNWQSISHIYEVHNSGPNTLPRAIVTLHIPTLQHENKMVLLENIEGTPTSLSDRMLPIECEAASTDTAGHEEVTVSAVTKSSSHMELTQEPESKAIFRLPKQTVKEFTLNCSTVPCSIYQCRINKVARNEGIVFKVKLQVHKNILSFLTIQQILHISSKLTLTFPNDPSLVNESKVEQTFQITTAVYPLTKKIGSTTVEVWIVAVSIVSGLLLMLIILVLMWKCGFFRRNKRDDLRKLMKASNSNETLSNTEHAGVDNSVMTGPNMKIMEDNGGEIEGQNTSDIHDKLNDT